MYKTVICIPYRNRQKHLAYFLEHTLPVLIEEMPDVHVVVVEQSADNRMFNRGACLNVAFQEYKNTAKDFIMHDVDVNPTRETIKTYYNKEIGENAVMGILTPECDSLGTIVKIGCDAAFKSNGFPNDYWGWGVEDKAIQNRCAFHGVKITKNILSNDPNLASYFLIFDDIDDRVKDRNINQKTHVDYTMWRQNMLSEETKRELVTKTGLNTLTYKVLSRVETNSYVTHLVVEL